MILGAYLGAVGLFVRYQPYLFFLQISFWGRSIATKLWPFRTLKANLYRSTHLPEIRCRVVCPSECRVWLPVTVPLVRRALNTCVSVWVWVGGGGACYHGGRYFVFGLFCLNVGVP